MRYGYFLLSEPIKAVVLIITADTITAHNQSEGVGSSIDNQEIDGKNIRSRRTVKKSNSRGLLMYYGS